MGKANTSKAERAAFVRTSIDGWNNDIDYWDRRTKYGKMMVDAYAFYRGTNQLYWHDFASDPRLAEFGNQYTTTWLEGDAHVYNLGAVSNDCGLLVYGLNDFDESIVADYQLDLWRMAVSVVLVARQNDNLSDDDTRAVVDALSSAYLGALRAFLTDKADEKQPITAARAYGKLNDFLKEVRSDDGRAEMLDKWAPRNKKGRRAFDLGNEKLGSATAQEKASIHEAMAGYWGTVRSEGDAAAADPDKCHVRDIARRLLAGTGSLGTDRYYLLLEDGLGVEHILDVKQEFKPSGYAFLSPALQADYDSHAQGNDARAFAVADRALSVCPDAYLGWMRLGDGWFGVRARSPYKEPFPALLGDAKGGYKSMKLDSQTRYTKLAQQWAWVLAADHAYAERVEAAHRGLDQTFEAQVVAAVAGHDKRFVELVRRIAFDYADQVETDWNSFVDGLGADIVPVE